MAEITTKLKTYNFHINGERGIYQTAFSIDDDNIESSCTCSYATGNKLCWHRYYVLAAKTYRLKEGEEQLQQELIVRLSKTQGGRELLSHAKGTFGEKELCRRCNSKEVMDLKKSFLGKFLKIFIPKGRRFFCWSCRWSW